MAEKRQTNVGVVLINDLGLYTTKYFIPLQNIQGTHLDVSFLIANIHYFCNNNRSLTPPNMPFDNNWRPPEYGKPLYYIKEKRVPEKLARAYLDAYSLDGKFGKIAKLGYLCVPDIEKVCQYLTSKNTLVQRQALQILHRDKTVIDLLYSALEASEDLKNEQLRGDVIKSVCKTITEALNYAPLSHEFKLPAVVLDRGLRQKLANGDEQRYADLMQNAVMGVYHEGRDYSKNAGRSK